ncbi:MAG: hypothetical protein HY000_35040 [Planctomycetes bacterium]|nr:hypothetical protein [Planctomycetota bacterium]
MPPCTISRPACRRRTSSPCSTRLDRPVGAFERDPMNGRWKGLKTKMGEQAYAPCVAAACASAVAVGADFILYGPVEDAKYGTAISIALRPSSGVISGFRPSLMHCTR